MLTFASANRRNEVVRSADSSSLCRFRFGTPEAAFSAVDRSRVRNRDKHGKLFRFGPQQMCSSPQRSLGAVFVAGRIAPKQNAEIVDLGIRVDGGSAADDRAWPRTEPVTASFDCLRGLARALSGEDLHRLDVHHLEEPVATQLAADAAVLDAAEGHPWI